MPAFRIAFIGLGAMGRPIARRLIQAGHSLALYDRASAALEGWVEFGARLCETAREAAEGAEVVMTIVPDSADVERAVLGKAGVAAGMAPGSILIEMSTIDPQTTRRVGARLSEKGLRMVDAPVFRSTQHAEKGELMFCIGGQVEDFERARAILSAAGKDFTHCGRRGAGVTMKLINNMMAQNVGAAVCESIVLGVKADLDLRQLMAVLTNSAASSKMLEQVYPEKGFQGNFDLGFAVDWAAKDTGHALAMAMRLGALAPITAAVRQLHAIAQSRGKGRLDHTAMLTVYEEIAGVQARLPKE